MPWIGLAWFVYYIALTGDRVDAAVYWAVEWPPDYSPSNVRTASYQYSPAFAFWVQPLKLLPWPLFFTLVVGLEVMALAYLIGAPFALLLIFVRAPIIWEELGVGNLNLIIAALLVLGMTRSWPWAFGLLTKVTPGFGLIWHVVRREWRLLGMALFVTLAVALPSAVLSPKSWADWFTLLRSSVGPAEAFYPSAPLILRWPLVVALLVWAARSNKPWLVPIAVAIAVPVNWASWLIALGAIRLASLPAYDQASPSKPPGLP
jgi:hypothetical protein